MLVLLEKGNSSIVLTSLPGGELSRTIKEAIDYYNNNSIFTIYLEFNGVKHKIDSTSDVDYLAKYWYNSLPKDEEIKLKRDFRIDKILNNGRS